MTYTKWMTNYISVCHSLVTDPVCRAESSTWDVTWVSHAEEHVLARTLSHLTPVKCTGEGFVWGWWDDTGGQGHATAVFIQGCNRLQDGWSVEFASSCSFSLWPIAGPVASPGLLETSGICCLHHEEDLGIYWLLKIPSILPSRLLLWTWSYFLDYIDLGYLVMHPEVWGSQKMTSFSIFVISTPLALFHQVAYWAGERQQRTRKLCETSFGHLFLIEHPHRKQWCKGRIK